jgi:acyl carrier protein
MEFEIVDKIVKLAISKQLNIPSVNLKNSDEIWHLGADYLDYTELVITLEEDLENYSNIKDDELGCILDNTFLLNEFTIGSLIQKICDHYNKDIIDEKN